MFFIKKLIIYRPENSIQGLFDDNGRSMALTYGWYAADYLQSMFTAFALHVPFTNVSIISHKVTAEMNNSLLTPYLIPLRKLKLLFCYAPFQVPWHYWDINCW